MEEGGHNLMPYSPSISITDTDPMVIADVETEFTDIRTWINAIPNSDIVADAVEAQHLLKPESYGYPTRHTRTDFQAVYGVHASPLAGLPTFIAEIGTTFAENWSQLQTREVFYADAMGTEDRIISSLSKRIRVDQTSDIVINLSAVIWCMGGTYNTDTRGAVRLVYRNVSDAGAQTDIPAATRTIQPKNVQVGPPHIEIGHNIVTIDCCVEDLTPAVYDVYLVFTKDAAAVGNQVIIAMQNLVIEVLGQ